MPSTYLHTNIDDWLTLVPHGQFVTRQWLLVQGVTLHALDNAVKSGKLLPLARGVYTRSDVPVDWQGVSASLNRVLDGPVYVGGLSALSQHGLTHYNKFFLFHRSLQSIARAELAWKAQCCSKFQLAQHSQNMGHRSTVEIRQCKKDIDTSG